MSTDLLIDGLASRGRRKPNALRQLLAPAIAPIPVRAQLLWLMSIRPTDVSTFDMRRVALESCGLSARRSRKDRTIEWIDAFCRWIEKGLHHLPPDERRVINEIMAPGLAILWDQQFWRRFDEAAGQCLAPP